MFAVLTAVELADKYSSKFDELEERIDILYRNLEKRINRLLADLINEVKDATGYALEIGSLDINLKDTIDVFERVNDIFYKRAKVILDEFPEDFLRELRRSIKLSAKSFEEKVDIMLKVMHVLYLARAREDIYHLNVLLYAYRLACKSEIRSAFLFVLAAIARFLKTKDYTSAHALAAYGVRDVLPLRDQLDGEIWENTERWSIVLQLSYDYEVGSLVSGELLASWGFLEALAGADEKRILY